MKKTRLQQMQEQMLRKLGQEQGTRVAQLMEQDFDKLCQALPDLPQDMARHVHNNIYPVASAFHALLAEGLTREAAAKEAGDAFLELMEATAQTIRKALKVPGLYRLMPWLWKTMMPKLFSKGAGFQFDFYPTDSKEVRFDMQKCPYEQVCRKIDCPELAPIFCATDDCCYGSMHPKLIWNRTKTIARGGDCCDFDLYIPKK